MPPLALPRTITSPCIWKAIRGIRHGRIEFAWPSDDPMELLVVHTALPLSAVKRSTCALNRFRAARNVFLKWMSSWL